LKKTPLKKARAIRAAATQERLVTLGPLAARALDALCRRYRVKPECVLQFFAESYLSDACSDDTLAPCAADAAREIGRTGKVPDDWWPKTELKSPGFEGEEADGREAA
jgi:hypothetical protein